MKSSIILFICFLGKGAVMFMTIVTLKSTNATCVVGLGMCTLLSTSGTGVKWIPWQSVVR